MKKLGIPFFVVLTVSLLTGCFEQDLEFNIRYQEVNGLTEGAALIHGDEVVGSVDEINYTRQGDFEVQVTIAEPHTNLATDTVLFVVTEDPNAENDRVIKLITDDNRGEPLKNGQTIEGSTALSGIAQEFQNQISSTLFSFAEGLDRSLAKLKEQNVDEHLSGLQNELDELINEAKTLSDSANEKLEHDIVPKIRQHIEQLKEELNNLGKDQSIDEIEQKINDLEGALEA